MKLFVASIVAAIVLLTWDVVVYSGKYRRAFSGMAGQIAAAYHVR